MLIELKNIKFDDSLSPRESGVSSQDVNDMVRAFRQGMEFPKIKIGKYKKHLYLVDGWHRVEMYKKLGYEEVEADLKDYQDLGILYADAVAYNSQHGKKLSSQDRIRALIRAGELGLEREVICNSLNISIDYANQIFPRKTAYTKDGKTIPLKRQASHLQGRELTKKQLDYIKKASGNSIVFHCRQIINLIESGTLPILTDKQEMALIDLRNRLNEIYKLDS